MAMLLGKKIGMTQVYDDQGKMIPVTVLLAGPCTVMQVKTQECDGYRALQLGYSDVKASRLKKPAQGHAQKANTVSKRFVREWRLDDKEQPAYAAGEQVDVNAFSEIKFVDVIGTCKGKGYAGVMKRHHFGGFPGSHGTERKHRAGGSICSFASDRGHGGNLKKGKKMGGRLGGDRITTKHHKLISIDAENNLLVVKGAVAGPVGAYVQIRSSKTRPQK
jgi:large subunit ribosomal protein L3